MGGPSVGVEEEFLLADPRTGRPVAGNREVAARAARRGVALQCEFTTAQVETATDKADTSSQLRQQISELRAAVAASAAETGAVLLAVGLPPTLGEPVGLTDCPRYRRMVDTLGMVTDERGNNGCHVHVEVPSRDAALAVSNWMRPWLPVMLALTANSAVFRDVDTGHSSWRHVTAARWPSAGPPPFFESPAHYDRMVAMLLDTGAALDDSMIYWDIRPSVRFPTVEVRIADVPATAAETVLYATLVRAAAMTALVGYERGDPAPDVADHVLRTACWKAAHDGLDGRLIDVLGDGRTVSGVRMLERWLTVLRPALTELGDAEWVCAESRRLLQRGNGAMRQRRALQRHGEIADVVAVAAAATLR